MNVLKEKYNEENLKYNDCYKYAVVRNILYDGVWKRYRKLQEKENETTRIEK